MIFTGHRADGENGAGRGDKAASGAQVAADTSAWTGALASSRPAPQRRRLVTAVLIGCYGLATLALLPFATRGGPELPGIIPFFVAGVLTTELTTSFLLFASFRQGRSLSLLLLACAYLYSGLMALPHLLTFPGALVAGGPIIGGPQSTATIFLLWILGYAALASLAVLMHFSFRNRRLPQRKTTPAIAIAVALVVAVVGLLALVAIAFADLLPSLIEGSRWSSLNLALNSLSVAMLAGSVAAILVYAGDEEELFLWLALALTAIAAANILSGVAGARYSLGWTVGRLSWVLSASVLFLYFMRQSARQQRFLAMANEVLEQRVAARTRELARSHAHLERSLAERDLLLREVYHRVKNNLQLVDSLLGFQASRLSAGEARAGLAEVRRRINALGLIHQQLMQSSDLSTLDVQSFLQALVGYLRTANGADGRAIAIEVSGADPVSANLDFAVPLGLLTTELVSRPLQEANKAGRIEVSLRKSDASKLTLKIADDGLTDSAKPVLPAGAIETRIVNALVAQLGGAIAIARNGGTSIAVEMPHPEAV
jgi:two-component sensor histidine kinase